MAIPLLAACNQASRTQLDDVLESGELRVLTRNAASSYYEGPNGATGLEYELAQGFADHLGVKLRVIVAENVSEVLAGVRDGKAHLAAAGLSVTEPRRQWVRFGPSYQEVTQQLVYRIGTPRPQSVGEIDGSLEVLAGSSHAERLRELKQENPELAWVENNQAGSEDLLTLVNEKVIDYTVVDSNELRLNQHYYPELRAAFDLAEPESLAWAFPRSADDSLYQRAVEYFEHIKSSGTLAHIIERHYGHVDKFDYVGTRIFMRHIRERLPKYRPLLERAAAQNGLDWRLVAAMAYQESHWDPDAVSPTGVRGFMMLTQATARYLGIKKRTDLEQSIDGGARYIRTLIDKVPERIQNPDRLWMAMAAYNLGYGHLNDARVITEHRGGNPDVWKDVEEHLPLLRKKDWYRHLKHGYARGNEAVVYVENIRSYYDILVWLTDQETPPTRRQRAAALAIATPVL